MSYVTDDVLQTTSKVRDEHGIGAAKDYFQNALRREINDMGEYMTSVLQEIEVNYEVYSTAVSMWDGDEETYKDVFGDKLPQHYYEAWQMGDEKLTDLANDNYMDVKQTLDTAQEMGIVVDDLDCLEQISYLDDFCKTHGDVQDTALYDYVIAASAPRVREVSPQGIDCSLTPDVTLVKEKTDAKEAVKVEQKSAEREAAKERLNTRGGEPRKVGDIMSDYFTAYAPDDAGMEL